MLGRVQFWALVMLPLALVNTLQMLACYAIVTLATLGPATHACWEAGV